MKSHQPCEATGTLLHEHARLRAALSRVHWALTSRAARQDDFVALLQELADDVAAHFRHEERGGYLVETIAMEPRLSARADQLLREHPLMTKKLADLRALAARSDQPRESRQMLQDRFAEFQEFFERHEAAESALLQEVYCDDIGAED